MKITFKTISKKATFTLEVEPELTVGDLKKKIELEQGADHPASAQKLIYSGKILTDTDTVGQLNIDEKKFVVVMITKPPPPPSQAAAQPSSSSSSKKSHSSKSSSSSSKHHHHQHQSSQQTHKASAAAAAAGTNAPQAPAAAAAAAAAVAAPASNPAIIITPRPSLQSNLGAHATLSHPTDPHTSMTNRLDMLSSQPEFQQLQQLVQQNPHLLNSTIEALSESNPELYQFISENPELFVSALNLPVLDNTAPPPAHRSSAILELISTQEDRAAIDRLKELGFSEDMAVQAYIACNKDEQLAADLLFQMD